MDELNAEGLALILKIEVFLMMQVYTIGVTDL